MTGAAMAEARPTLIVVAGPNGAGKSTVAPRLLRDRLGVKTFVNADAIAQAFTGFDPESYALAAGRLMMRRLRELAQQRVSFAFETTLASRTFAPWIRDLVQGGYRFVLLYMWVESPELSIARVRQRVLAGGHFVPEDVIRRRWQRGLDNFFGLYAPLARRWRIYDNSSLSGPRLVARGGTGTNEVIRDAGRWQVIQATQRKG